ncbi:hypothetical protein G6F38_011386 [Rhizopus arrhizus]|nr:hypothetical protein G6F38_011386 [Rhizopus arrhizus]
MKRSLSCYLRSNVDKATFNTNILEIFGLDTEKKAKAAIKTAFNNCRKLFKYYFLSISHFIICKYLKNSVGDNKKRDETVVNFFPSTESPSSIDLTAATTEIITAGAATTPTQSKRVKPMYSYLEGRSIQDEPVHEEIKRHFNGIDVSSKLLHFRELCKQEATRGVELRSNIEELAINAIFFISPNNNKYNDISESTYTAMIQELADKYGIGEVVNLDDLENFQVQKLRKIYKLAKWDSEKARKLANNLMYDEEGFNEMLCQSIINFLTEHSAPLSPSYNEDMFTKKFITPLLSPFLKETKYFKLFGNDEHSEGSKERRGKHGRIPDGGLKVVYKEHEQQILLMEIKSPKVINEDRIYHPDFTKLANLMKDEVDLMLSKDFPEDTPVFGVLLGGHYGRVFVMDLVYTKIYRLFEIGSFLLPHNTKDLNRLDDVFDTMVKLNVLMGDSAAKCLKVLQTKSSPVTPPRR